MMDFVTLLAVGFGTDMLLLCVYREGAVKEVMMAMARICSTIMLVVQQERSRQPVH